MELDFSRLEGLAQGQRSLQGLHAEEAGMDTMRAADPLQREADRRQDAQEKALAVYRTYQENIAKAEGLRAELLKGGEGGRGCAGAAAQGRAGDWADDRGYAV